MLEPWLTTGAELVVDAEKVSDGRRLCATIGIAIKRSTATKVSLFIRLIPVALRAGASPPS